MAECELPKLETGVRFPSPAPPDRDPFVTFEPSLLRCRGQWRYLDALATGTLTIDSDPARDRDETSDANESPRAEIEIDRES